MTCNRCNADVTGSSAIEEDPCQICHDIQCIGCFDGAGRCMNCDAIVNVRHDDVLGGTCGRSMPLCSTCADAFKTLVPSEQIESGDTYTECVGRSSYGFVESYYRRNAWRVRHRQGQGKAAMCHEDMISALLSTAAYEFGNKEGRAHGKRIWNIGDEFIVNDESGFWRNLSSSEEGDGVLSFVIHLGYADDEKEAYDYCIYIGTICECIDMHSRECSYPMRLYYPPVHDGHAKSLDEQAA